MMTGAWKIRRKIIRAVLCCVVYNDTNTRMSSSYCDCDVDLDLAVFCVFAASTRAVLFVFGLVFVFCCLCVLSFFIILTSCVLSALKMR